MYKLAASCLPEGVKLKLDRKDGLYVARVEPAQIAATAEKLIKNGFLATIGPDILTIAPSRAIIEWLAGRDTVPDVRDHLYNSLARLSGRSVCEGEIALFIKACKRRFYDPATIERQLRKQAAECMRHGCGGLLHAICFMIIFDEEVTI